MQKKLWIFTADIVIAAAVVAGIWEADYVVPQKGVAARPFGEYAAGKIQETEENADVKNLWNAADEANGLKMNTTDGQEENLQRTKVILDSQDWHKKFAGHFTENVVVTDDSYTSPDLSIHLTHDSFDTKKTDSTDSGRHEIYGTKAAYVLADIYVGDITCLQTAFARDMYGIGYTEKLTDMSKRMESILAVNGDSYSNDMHRDNGTIIRNGVIYRAEKTDMETCVLNWDGTMKIYSPEELNTQQLIEEGAYQSWIFGPSLLDENGKAKTSFLTWDYIRQAHPRTAIGYYEPGHYCLLCVDGRQPDYSRGMFLDEMAQLFEKLGCKAAYNLDGGHCTFMTMKGNMVNHPYKPEHEIPDGIFVREALHR